MKVIRARLIVFAAILIGVLAIFIGGSAFLIQAERAENERIARESVAIKDNAEVIAGGKVRVTDFLEKLEGEIIDDYEIIAEYPGEVEVYFEYFDIKNRKQLGNFTLHIVDKTAPRIYGGSYFVLPVGYDGDLVNLMLSGDDFDDYPERKIVGDYNLNKVGTYNLEYVITDKAGNSAQQKFTLEIVAPSNNEIDTPQASESIDFKEIVAEYKTEKTKIGIDVSSWQGEINWQKVKQAGVEFAIIRIGYQVGYDGEYVVDKYFEDNMSGATEVGLPIGVYFYSYADSVEQAVRQAKWIAEELRGHEVELGVVFDWEDWASFNEVGMSFYTINKVAQRFLETTEEAGYKGVLYGSKNYLERIWNLSEYEVWLAQYYDRPTYSGEFSIWQMTDSGRVDGIYGNVDVDVMYLR